MDIGGRTCFQYDFTKIETLVVMYSPLTCRYKFILARYQYTPRKSDLSRHGSCKTAKRHALYFFQLSS